MFPLGKRVPRKCANLCTLDAGPEAKPVAIPAFSGSSPGKISVGGCPGAGIVGMDMFFHIFPDHPPQRYSSGILHPAGT